MKIYIDFDGVILDTDTFIDNECIKNNIEDKKEYIKKTDWDIILESSDIIHNSLTYLKDSTKDINLLSKISTLEEGIAKTKFLRKNEIDMNIHLVPTKISKSDIVSAKGNILIDDKVYNLDKWKEEGGIPIFFNKYNEDIDIYGKKNTNYPKINSLDIIVNQDKFNEII